MLECIHEKLLAVQLGMSRTPVATTLAQLASDGVLTQVYNHMAVVAAEAGDWLIHIREVRQLLKPSAAERAAGQFSHDVAEDLFLLQRDAKPSRNDDWQLSAVRFDFALHLAIAEFCHNRPLTFAFGNVGPTSGCPTARAKAIVRVFDGNMQSMSGYSNISLQEEADKPTG